MAPKKVPMKTRRKKRKLRGGANLAANHELEHGLPKCQATKGCKNSVIKGHTFCLNHEAKGPQDTAPLSGSELPYGDIIYNKDKAVKNSHNCYSYAMGVVDANKVKNCRTKNNCVTAQPGRDSKYNISKKESQSCSDIISRTMGDIPKSELSTFGGQCKPGFRKVASAVDKYRDYHWYRQDNNGMWSHKPGTRAVTDVDAFGSKIYNPELASRNYPSEYDGDTGLNYEDFCSYMCIPANPDKIQIAGKR